MKRIDENHSFNVNVACIVGDRKAIILKEIYGWCLKNLQNDRNIKHGHAWTYNSAKAYGEKFPYWNEKTISRWLNDLENDGWVASSNLNKVKFDRTKWYTINFRRYDLAVTGCEMTKEDIEKWKEEISTSIPQNEECNPNNEESDFSETDNQDSHNEEPIPSLPISSPSSERKDARAENDPGFEKFKKNILENLKDVSLDFEIGYCKKRQRECYGEPLFDYYEQCIEFLESLQEKEKSSAKKEKEPNPMFAPDAHNKAAEWIIAWLEENKQYLDGMEFGDWKRAVHGHCLKLQKQGEFYQLQIPDSDAEQWQWISKRLAGVKSWYAAARDIDKKSNNGKQRKNKNLISEEEARAALGRLMDRDRRRQMRG